MADTDDIAQQTEPAPALALAPMAPDREAQRRWDTMYEKLERTYRASGKCSFSKTSRADLHNWILEQRVANANNELSANKRVKLDQIHFAWMSQDEKNEEIWNTMFESLETYKAAHGDCLVPEPCQEDPKLYNWVKWQRRMNKEGKLLRHRRDRLLGIGFCWDASKASDDSSQLPRRDPAPGQDIVLAPSAAAGGQTSWDVMYEKLARYYGTKGSCSKSSMADLHTWILEQRVANANNELSANKRLKLDQINFPWKGQDEKHEEIWNNMFESLETYKAAYGDCLVPEAYQEDPKLYNWIKRQRCLNKKGKLPLHRRDRLEGMGFCWGGNPKPKATKQAPSLDGPEAQPNVSAGAPTSVSLPPSGSQQPPPPRWNLQLERLKIYQAWHDDCLVPTSYDKELADWVFWQHHLHKINKLREPRYGKLERIGFFSDSKAEKSLNGGTKCGATTRAPQKPEARPLAGAQDLPGGTSHGSDNPEGGVDLSRSPKRARMDDGFAPFTS